MSAFKRLQDWMLHWAVSQQMAAGERAERMARSRALRRKAWPWLACLLLVALIWVLVPPRPPIDWLHGTLAVALVPPLVMLGRLRFRELLAGDELEQRIELLAMGITFIAALCALLLLSLLAALGGPLAVHPLWGFYALFFGHLLIARLVRARYR